MGLFWLPLRSGLPVVMFWQVKTYAFNDFHTDLRVHAKFCSSGSHERITADATRYLARFLGSLDADGIGARPAMCLNTSLCDVGQRWVWPRRKRAGPIAAGRRTGEEGQ